MSSKKLFRNVLAEQAAYSDLQGNTGVNRPRVVNSSRIVNGASYRGRGHAENICHGKRF